MMMSTCSWSARPKPMGRMFSLVLLMGFLGGVVSGCEGEIGLQESCGDNVAYGGEVCDGSDLRRESCESLGFEGGTLRCSAACDGYDTSSCTGSGPMCGDGVIDVGEVCDGAELAGEDCVSQGYDGGSLACRTACDGFDTSGCTGSGPVCGDGVVDVGEVCDGAELGGEDCVSQGFAGGTLYCGASCDNYDTSGCQMNICGNAAIEAGEVCDGEIGRASCRERVCVGV